MWEYYFTMYLSLQYQTDILRPKQNITKETSYVYLYSHNGKTYSTDYLGHEGRRVGTDILLRKLV